VRTLIENTLFTVTLDLDSSFKTHFAVLYRSIFF